jgi:nucleoside-diphosphate-sugar epimerase
MNIFVTGSTGFIGSYVTEVLIGKGFKVFALRRDSRRVPRVNLSAEPIWVEGDLTSDLFEVLSSCDVLIHLAAHGIPPRSASWSECFQVNVQESMQLFECALRANVRRVIVCGSYAEYGSSGLRYDRIPPDAPLEPTDAYAASKAAASIGVTALCKKEKFELIYFRLFSAFGEGQHENNLWPSLKKAAQNGIDYEMTPGEQIRDFIPVNEVAEWFVKAVETTAINPGEPVVLNLASGRPQTIREFATHWWDQWGAKGNLKVGALPYRQYEVMRYVPLVSSDLL